MNLGGLGVSFGALSGTGRGSGGGAQALIPATLAIFAGQSNGKGWSSDPLNTATLTNGNAYEFYPSGASGVFLPLGNNLFGRTQGGPQRAFAQAWAAGGGGTVLCVDTAVNGASMDNAAKGAQTGSDVNLGGGTWDLSQGGASLYNAWAKPLVQSAMAAATANGFSIAKKVVIWAQGEQDGGAGGATNGTVYATKLQALIDQFAADFSINAFLISALGVNASDTGNTFWTAIRTAQSTAAAARSSVAQIAFSGAVNFQTNGQMVDNLHYTQAGYNLMGAGVAASGLAFLGGLALTPPTLAKFTAMTAALPAIAGWWRTVMTTTRSGAITPQFYSGGATPYAPTWIDNSGTNPTAANNPAWSFPSAVSKKIYLYLSNQIGGSGTFVAGGNLSMTNMAFPDSGLRINTINLGSGGDYTAAFTCAEAELITLEAATLATLILSSDLQSSVVLSNATLSRFSNLTLLIINKSLTPRLNMLLGSNLTRFDQVQCLLSVADINQILQDFDANGKSGGTLSIAQSPPPSAPTGAGVTAKANLIGKGWSVTTD